MGRSSRIINYTPSIGISRVLEYEERLFGSRQLRTPLFDDLGYVHSSSRLKHWLHCSPGPKVPHAIFLDLQNEHASLGAFGSIKVLRLFDGPGRTAALERSGWVAPWHEEASPGDFCADEEVDVEVDSVERESVDPEDWVEDPLARRCVFDAFDEEIVDDLEDGLVGLLYGEMTGMHRARDGWMGSNLW